MRRSVLNFALDAVSAALLLGMIATGLLIRFVLPPGSRGGAGLSLWGWGRHDYGDLHFWLAVSLLALVVVHVVLHWTWICTVVGRLSGGAHAGPIRPRPVARNLGGVAFAILVVLAVAIFLSVAASGVVTAGGGRQAGRAAVDDECARCPEQAAERGASGGAAGARGRAGRGPAPDIRGSTTLGDVSTATGQSLDEVRRALGLPACAGAGERLSELRRQHGLTLSRVRDFVAAGGARHATAPASTVED
ncbi:MAG: DUF4405 domain-containing protein [Phycisphaerae bacterium]